MVDRGVVMVRIQKAGWGGEESSDTEDEGESGEHWDGMLALVENRMDQRSESNEGTVSRRQSGQLLMDRYGKIEERQLKKKR